MFFLTLTYSASVYVLFVRRCTPYGLHFLFSFFAVNVSKDHKKFQTGQWEHKVDFQTQHWTRVWKTWAKRQADWAAALYPPASRGNYGSSFLFQNILLESFTLRLIKTMIAFTLSNYQKSVKLLDFFIYYFPFSFFHVEPVEQLKVANE